MGSIQQGLALDTCRGRWQIASQGGSPVSSMGEQLEYPATTGAGGQTATEGLVEGGATSLTVDVGADSAAAGPAVEAGITGAGLATIGVGTGGGPLRHPIASVYSPRQTAALQRPVVNAASPKDFVPCMDSLAIAY